MSYNPQLDIATFMNMCGQKVETHPTISDAKTRLLRAKLLFEETKEFIEAAGCFIGVDEAGDYEVFTDEEAVPDLVGMADGLADIRYVAYGADCAFGLDASRLHTEVHRSNMSKANPDGTITKNEFGKVIKSPSYSPADLESEVNFQGTHPYKLIDRLEMDVI